MPEQSPNNFAGIEVALATMRGVLISEAGEVIGRRESTYEPENLISAIADLTKALRESGEIRSVGVAIPGLVNRETDRVLISTGPPFTAHERDSRLRVGRHQVLHQGATIVPMPSVVKISRRRAWGTRPSRMCA